MELISFPIRLTRDPYVGNQRKRTGRDFRAEITNNRPADLFCSFLIIRRYGHVISPLPSNYTSVSPIKMFIYSSLLVVLSTRALSSFPRWSAQLNLAVPVIAFVGLDSELTAKTASSSSRRRPCLYG